MECTICLDQENCLFVSLQCKHTFHATCIAKWLVMSRTCPICRNQESEIFEDIQRTNFEHQRRQELHHSAYTNIIQYIAILSIISIVAKPLLHSALLLVALFLRNFRLLVLLLPGKWFLAALLVLVVLEIKQFIRV